MNTFIEFGSHHHGCNDVYSDRDIFILYDDFSNIKNETSELESKGFSVTTCSKERAEYLSSQGSLFSRHVFFEGKITKGSEENVKKIRELWTPSSSYDFEIEDNKLLLSILETAPSTLESKAAINDIIICSLRNVLIRKLANIGIFEFSWKSILSESSKFGFINKNDTKVMLLARRYKNIYREGLVPSIKNSFIDSLEEIVQKVIDNKRKIKYGTHKQITSLPEKLNDGTYSQLRSIELLCSHYNFDESMEKYLELTKNPSYFCNVGPNKLLQSDSSNGHFFCHKPGKTSASLTRR